MWSAHDSPHPPEQTPSRSAPMHDFHPQEGVYGSLDRGQVISLAPPGGYRSHDHLDVPQSVSPGRTPVGSPRSTQSAATSKPPSPPQVPLAAGVSRPTIPERNYSAPVVQKIPARIASAARSATRVAAPPPEPFRDDPIAADLNRGRQVLRLLRAQELSDYETHDRQQLIDSHEIQKLMASLRSWGKECEIQSYRGSAWQMAFVGAAPSSAILTELESANEGRFRQLKLALARGSMGPLDGPPEGRSPQHEIRNPYSPPLSRQSSTSSRQGSLFRFSPIKKNSDVSSARSSLSGESLFSRDSISSYVSAASSAASAAFLSPTEGVLTSTMIDPLILDLSSILANEWNIDQCLLSLPSLLLRLEVLDTWLYGLRLRRKRISQGSLALHANADASTSAHLLNH